MSATKPSDINNSTVDADGLLEYSVVYSDRALNHVSNKFQGILKELAALLREVYQAENLAIFPGSGTSSMEAVARQFANKEKVMVVRNGFFSFRWSQIFEMGGFAGECIVHKARPVEEGPNPSYAPCPVEEVVASIHSEKPGVVFAPHVETSCGMILPNDYIMAVSGACREVGALFVLDCVASGCLWIDMKAMGVDVIVTAPQKGWSAHAGVGVAMLGERAVERLATTTSSSWVLDLKKWVAVMDAYLNTPAEHPYQGALPTDTILKYLEAAKETQSFGFSKVNELQVEQGKRVRAMLLSKGIKSVAAEGFAAPSVVVVYTSDPGMKSGAKFAAEGMQIAGGVPLMVDEFTSGTDFLTWRVGLFGLDKLGNQDRTVSLLEDTLTKMSV